MDQAGPLGRSKAPPSAADASFKEVSKSTLKCKNSLWRGKEIHHCLEGYWLGAIKRWLARFIRSREGTVRADQHPMIVVSPPPSSQALGRRSSSLNYLSVPHTSPGQCTTGYRAKAEAWGEREAPEHLDSPHFLPSLSWTPCKFSSMFGAARLCSALTPQYLEVDLDAVQKSSLHFCGFWIQFLLIEDK